MDIIQNRRTIFPHLRGQRSVVLVVALVALLLYLPSMLTRVQAVDQLKQSTVPLGQDDQDFQILALNILHGHSFSDYPHLPWQEYHFPKPIRVHPKTPWYSFSQAPGFPLVLSATYLILGAQTLSARYLIAVLVWLTALLLVLFGDRLAGWLGTIAGAIAGYYHMNYGIGMGGSEGLYAGRILSEPVAAFWLVLFALIFLIYLMGNRSVILYLAAGSLAALILTNAYFWAALPLFVIYLYRRDHDRKKLAIFAIIILIPILVWSLYGSLTTKSWVIISTQGEREFPLYNNVDVLEGVSPDQVNKGGRQPGFVINSDGELTVDFHHEAGPDENGWVKGLQYWGENLNVLHLLFFAKMEAGFSFPHGGLYPLGIGMLLLSIGFTTKARESRLLINLSSGQVFTVQLALIGILAVTGNNLPFISILSIWLTLLVIAVFRPYGDLIQPVVQPPTWILLFVASYLITTLFFGGNMYFLAPLDPILMLVGILSFLVLVYEIWSRDKWLAIFFLLISVGAMNSILQAILGRDMSTWLWERIIGA